MDKLLDHGRKIGLSPSEITTILRRDRPLSESNWCLGKDLKERSLDMARDLFEAGRFIEYQCYEDNGNLQGRAIIKLERWLDVNEGFLEGEHGAASDPYYDWYVKNELSKGVAFHICRCEAKACKKRLARGDKRILIHIDQWRMLSPQTMLETSYLRDMGLHLGEAAERCGGCQGSETCSCRDWP